MATKLQKKLKLSSRVYDAIFSSSVLDVHLVVLQADGDSTSTCIEGVRLVLIDAGVELYDLVPSRLVDGSKGHCGINQEGFHWKHPLKQWRWIRMGKLIFTNG